MCTFCLLIYYRVSSESGADDSYLQLPVSVFVPAALSLLALVVCCLSCCLRCCGCCSCCMTTREHQSLLDVAASTQHQSQRKPHAQPTSLQSLCVRGGQPHFPSPLLPFHSFPFCFILRAFGYANCNV